MGNSGQGALDYVLLIGGLILVAVVIIVLLSIPDNCTLEEIDIPGCWTQADDWVCDEWEETGKLINCVDLYWVDQVGSEGKIDEHGFVADKSCEKEKVCIHETRVETRIFTGAIE